MSLADEMRAAADTLKAVNLRYGSDPGTPWSWQALHREADVVESEDRETAELDALVEELAAGMAPVPFGALSNFTQNEFRQRARELIESGWRKADAQ